MYWYSSFTIGMHGRGYDFIDIIRETNFDFYPIQEHGVHLSNCKATLSCMHAYAARED